MDRLARNGIPQGSYDVIVIGSGYGGAIAASRLARAGKRVCLLERGAEIQPGEYPDTLLEAGEQTQITYDSGHVGSRLGMFDFRAHSGMSALVGCGLGGTSLINANVSLWPDRRVFAQDEWPVELHDPDVLAPFRARAERMLVPVPYPAEPGGALPLPKTAALDASAATLDTTKHAAVFELTPINVNFEPEHRNHAGTLQRPCNNCGDCVTGCNVRAKNTTLMNYLPDARNHGAEIFVRCAVSHVEQDGEGWRVRYTWLGSGQEDFDAPEFAVSAGVVVLAAGTLGSTEIMLRSCERGLTTSPRIGERFSGNGDVLAFGYDVDRVIDGVGYGERIPDPHRPVGPCITGVVHRTSDDHKRDWVIEEGAIPGAIGHLTAFLLAVADHVDPDAAGADPERVSPTPSGDRTLHARAIDRTQTYLVMSHDDSAGVLKLDQDRLRIEWDDPAARPNFAAIQDDLRTMTVEGLHGTFIPDPISKPRFGSKLITVHPLGGCVMGADAEHGVVNHKGQVFSSTAGSDVHAGLYVADGAIVPTSLGTNPSLTISAVAERIVELLAHDRGWQFECDSDSTPPQGEEPPKPGLIFTERMAGFWSPRPVPGFDVAEQLGRDAGRHLEATLTVESDDLETMISSQAHEASVCGTVECPALSDEPLTVINGTIHLFTADPDRAASEQMVYDLPITDVTGARYLLHGVKQLPQESVLKAWDATTTLYVTISRDGTDLGRGVMHISLRDFIQQVQTFRVLNVADRADRRHWLERFGRWWVGNFWDRYGGVLASITDIDWEPTSRIPRPLRVGPVEQHPFVTRDGTALLLTRYRPPTAAVKGPVMLVHGLGVSSQIFSIDTIEPNLLEYLYQAGYDCWLLDFRCSTRLPASSQPGNGDLIAQFDLPDAVETVLAATDARSVQMIVHCYGATTFTMAMLGGHLATAKVRSAVISQISADVRTRFLTALKSQAHVADLLRVGGVHALTSNARQDENAALQLFDRAFAAPYAHLVAQGGQCHDPVCHRIAFLYGSLHSHTNLNTATHDVLHEMFGIAHIDHFRHLSTMVRHRRIVDFDGHDVYYQDENLARMMLPLLFLHGDQNHCYKPISTELTYQHLCRVNGGDLYQRCVTSGYTHLDNIYGKRAAQDVYPLILTHLDAHHGPAYGGGPAPA